MKNTTKKNSNHIGENIRRIIDNKGIKIIDFADKIGYTREYVHVLLKKKDINTSILKKIAKELHINISELVINEEKTVNNSHTNIYKTNKTEQHLNKNTVEYEERIKAMEREIELLRDLVKTKDDFIKLLTKND